MSQTQTPLETTQSYSPPSVTQFSVFLDNRVGKLYELVEMLDNLPGCQIAALSVHEASDHAVVRIITTCSTTTKQALRAKGHAFSEKSLLVVELVNNHTLPGLCMGLLGAEINIHFAYPLMLGPAEAPTIAISVDDLLLAGQVLRRKGFRLLGEADLPRG